MQSAVWPSDERRSRGRSSFPTEIGGWREFVRVGYGSPMHKHHLGVLQEQGVVETVMFGFSVYDNEYKKCDHAHAVLSLCVIEINTRKMNKDRRSPLALFTISNGSKEWS